MTSRRWEDVSNMPSNRQKELSKKNRRERTKNKSSSTITRIEDIPPELVTQLQERVTTEVTAQIETSLFRGPLPHPELYAEYEKVLPGTAVRILRMTEVEQSFRHKLTTDNLGKNYKLQTFGLCLGFILALCIAMGGLWIVLNGKSIEGFVSFFTGIGCLVAAATYRHKSKKSAQNS